MTEPRPGATIQCPRCRKVQPWVDRCPNCDYPLAIAQGPRAAAGPVGPGRNPDLPTTAEETIVGIGATTPPASSAPPASHRPQPSPNGPACPSCQHVNPAGRTRCERCAAQLVAPAQSTVLPMPPEPTPPVVPVQSGFRPRPTRLLVGLTVGSVVVLLLAILLAYTLGRRSGPPPVPGPGSTSRSSGPSSPTQVRRVDRTTIQADAESFLSPTDERTYYSKNTLDGVLTTAWNSDGDGALKEGTLAITYSFDEPVDLREVTIWNGYQARRNGQDLFTANSRPKRIRLVTETGSWTLNLLDRRTPQVLRKEFGRTSTLTIDILTVYEGERYADVAISEIAFGQAA